MVTVLVQRQRREAAQRKQRLLAARQAAAQLSVQQARSYKEQKRKQEEDVREDAHKAWMQAQTRDLQAIDALVQRGIAQQNDGHEAAARLQADGQREACAEGVAWQAEHELEAARHRLAVAYTRAEAHKRQVPRVAAQHRREAVREAERMRAARVAAAPSSALPLAEVMRSLRAAPNATANRKASIPVAYPADVPSDEGAAASPGSSSSARRHWRMSCVAPHAKVTVHVSDEPFRSACSERCEGELKDDAVGGEDTTHEVSAGALQRATHAYALECATALVQREKTLTDGQHKAAQRAASALRRQHEERMQAEAARQAQWERLAAVKAAYRHPREADENSPRKQNDDAAAAQVTTQAGTADVSRPIVGSTPSPHRASPHSLARQHQVQKVYRESEDDFRATFIDGPSVAVHAGASAPRTAPLSELLRPAQVADLLYSVAHGASLSSAATGATPPSPSSLPGRGAAKTVGMQREVPPTRVLPSAPLRMQPLYPPAESTTADSSRAHSGGAGSPSQPVARPGSGNLSAVPCTGGWPASSLTEGERPAVADGAQRNCTLPQPLVRETHHDVTRVRSPSSSLHEAPRKAGEEPLEVAVSPLKPAAIARGGQRGGPDQAPSSPPPQQPMHEGNANVSEADARAAVATQSKEQEVIHVSSRPSTAVSAATTPLNTPSRHSHQHTDKLSSSSTSTPLSGTDEQSRLSGLASGDSGSSVDSSGSSASTGSSSSLHPLPTMTAEQLKLALIRLRSRIKTAQM
ncbi:hypothetical protein ABL78_4239 [Leptomonas seymouri]|uniref:Uncharacterized protein n=1 Tax=Leptomonas seymouri TaxID=5684 RepID=A0A0N1HWW2_LEPSE|nr:hypothetical protein ABL78_4239 [Leptomonas seymouri]|eukprot:KPI86681.1 hypothetical protein ABL78_4239 [Leptomonas seymouri]